MNETLTTAPELHAGTGNNCKAVCHAGPEVDYICDLPSGHDGQHTLIIQWAGPECALPVTADDWHAAFAGRNARPKGN